MRTIKKRELLKAMKQILLEYKKTQHTTKLTECGLCKMFYEDINDLFPQCTSCPMNVFEGNFSPFPCKKRKCEPIDCNWESYYLGTKKLPAVIEFYEEVIEIVKTMTSRQMNKVDAFKFLIDIDNKVAKKYKLCK
jgi:hypothetical protein